MKRQCRRGRYAEFRLFRCVTRDAPMRVWSQPCDRLNVITGLFTGAAVPVYLRPSCG